MYKEKTLKVLKCFRNPVERIATMIYNGHRGTPVVRLTRKYTNSELTALQLSS